MTLTTNIGAQLFSDNSLGDFSKQLLTIGDGTTPSNAAEEMAASHIGIPVDTLDDLTTAAFPNLHVRELPKSELAV